MCLEFDVSMLHRPPQCLHNTGSVQGCERDEGRPTINFTQCTLHCHHTSVLHVDLQSKLLFMWMLRWKVESDVVDPDRWSCRLVGRCPQTGSRSQRCRYSGHVTSKTSHTQHLGLYVFPHKITKSQEFWIFWKENILSRNWELNWASWKRGGSEGRCQVDGRTRHTPLLFHFVWISSFFAMMMFQKKRAKTL